MTMATEASVAMHATERRAAAIAVAVGIVLMAVKFVAWRLTGSSAVYSDALESIINVVASGFALWAISQAHRPADRTHPYGHGRFEFVSMSVEGALIGAAGASIVWEAVHRMLAGDLGVQRIEWGLILIGTTAVGNGVLGAWLMKLGRRSGSAALVGDGRHLISDAITSLGAIAALVAVRMTGLVWIDPLVAILMACILVGLGIRMVRRSLGELVDEQDAGDYETVRKILDAHISGTAGARAPLIRGWHKLRTRHIGRHHWVDFHVQVDDSLDVRTAHDLASSIEYEIEVALGWTDGGNATAHIEPWDEPVSKPA
jgi:cation diffusion facilitator family transporter